MSKVDDFLQHNNYNYDPVKAHEYYMRTRKLKGRSTRGMNSQQKERWEYVRNQISTEKKGKVKANTAIKDAAVQALRGRAEDSRKRISEKLKKLLEATQESMAKQLKDIPKNASPEKRAKLLEERKKELAKIRGEAAVEREKTRSDLKSLIATTRATYKQARADLDATYEKTYQTEYEKVAGKGKTAKKGRK